MPVNNQIMLSEQNEILYLHLGSSAVQSAMSKKDPLKLILSYTRAMVAVLLFCPHLTRIAHIGLGGGALLRWFYAYFPAVRQTVLEINPHIIRAAKTVFGLPSDHEKITIKAEDGYVWLKNLATHDLFDLILVDAFNARGLIDKFSRPVFFARCRRHLSGGGFVVFNWWQNNPKLEYNLCRLRAVFPENIIQCPAAVHGNIAVMAGSETLNLTAENLTTRARILTAATNVNFEELAARIKQYNGGSFSCPKLNI